MKYRVTTKAGYIEIHYDFDDKDDALEFIDMAFSHVVPNADVVDSHEEVVIYMKKVLEDGNPNTAPK